MIVGLYVTRGDGVGQKSEAARRQSVDSGFLRHKWKKSITAGNTRGAMVSKNTHCIALQGCISCGTCSYLELTEDHVLTSAYVKIFRIVTRNAVNKRF